MAAEDLCFEHNGRIVPVTHVSSVSRENVLKVLESDPFKTWCKRCERTAGRKQIQINSVEIQSVDMFGARGVGFVKINSHCTLVEDGKEYERRLPGICFLRGSAVAIMVALYCTEDGSEHALLVDQPRVPIGQASCLEIAAGMLDDENNSVLGTAVQEIEEECGIKVKASDLIDLTGMALAHAVDLGNLPVPAIPPSPGGCDEFVRFMYLEKSVSRAELEALQGKLTGLRHEHGEYITVHVVPMKDVWRISGDAKAMISLFLLDQLRRDGSLPPPGKIATPIDDSSTDVQSDREPVLTLSDGTKVPQLAFGLYKIPDSDEGATAILKAIQAGYRHFDGASFYGNEIRLGRALAKNGLPRSAFYLVGKVWNDAVKAGRAAVRESVEKSLQDLGPEYGDYFDLFLVHWPVPGFFTEAYKELEELHKEGKIRSLGLSNFNEEEYETLIQAGITIKPVLNQMEVSPVMYRPELVNYFQDRGIQVSAFKALNRAGCLDRSELVQVAKKHSVTVAQVMLRWGIQKNLIVVSKTVTPDRMEENRSIFHFALDPDDMKLLDSLTTEEDLRAREDHEKMRKTSL